MTAAFWLTSCCSWSSEVCRRHQLAARLLALERLPPSWLAGVLPAPLRLGGAAATSDGGAHAGMRNGPRVLPLQISNINAKKKGIAKKLILTIRAILISQEVDLLLVISMEQHGDAAAETISVL